MNILFNHQFREGNQVADFLARMGESGQNVLYENFQDLPQHIKAYFGLTNWVCLILEGNGFSIWFIFLGLFRGSIILQACLDLILPFFFIAFWFCLWEGLNFLICNILVDLFVTTVFFHYK